MSNSKLESDPISVLGRFGIEIQVASPLFQRRYVWERNNVDQLWEDIETLLDGSHQKRFLGALVFAVDRPMTAAAAGRYWIIDGQQRLLTLYLLLLAIADAAWDSGTVGRELATDTVMEYALSNRPQTKLETRVRPTLRDTRQFETIVYDVTSKIDVKGVKVNPVAAPGEVSGRMLDAFDRLRFHLTDLIGSAETPESKVEILEGLRSAVLDNVEFVEIRLGSEHDPNEVFDRLNKEGERLGVLDLIRNHVLRHLDHEPQLALDAYNNDWLPFEQGFTGFVPKAPTMDITELAERQAKADADAQAKYFFPFALTIDNGVTQATVFSKLSTALDDEVGESPRSTVNKMVGLLRKHQASFNAIHAGEQTCIEDDDLKEMVRRLVAMNRPSSVYPYVMQLLTAVSLAQVESQDAVRCLAIIESFLVRRALRGIEPTGLHAIFKKLWVEAGGDPAAVRKAITSSTVVYPSDEEFAEAVRSGDLYNRKICRYVLLEHERDERLDDVLPPVHKVTVDHVMPQAAEPGRWSATADDHKRLLHTWANLALLSSVTNSTKGASDWSEAKDRLSGEVAFKTTVDLYMDHDLWTPREIEERSKVLERWARNRWPSYEALLSED